MHSNEGTLLTQPFMHAQIIACTGKLLASSLEEALVSPATIYEPVLALGCPLCIAFHILAWTMLKSSKSLGDRQVVGHCCSCP